ncbi:MAG TPA: hypothetical protein VMV44_12850 [Rectinemataceae bacterium]|nr:hypothetical protein [Rectinemataceae bacterium]
MFRLPYFYLILSMILGGAELFAQDGENDSSFPPSVIASAGAEDAAIYADLLESLLAGDFARAEDDRRKLASSWPSSPFVAKAEAMMARYARLRDTSGIVPFYIGNMITGTAISALVPSYLIGYQITNQAANGALYLGGAGLGLASAWLMSKEGDFSLARELWIESVTALSAMSWFLLYDAYYPMPPYDPNAVVDLTAAIPARDRIEFLGLSAALLAGRGLSWALIGPEEPSLGRAAFAAQASAWSLYYAFAIMEGLVQTQDSKLLATVLVVAGDGALAAGAMTWDRLGWSAYRSGLISVGGIAGILFGAGINMIAEGLASSLDSRVPSLIMIAGALSGQTVAAVLTRGMAEERKGTSRLGMAIYPVFAGDSPALGISGTIAL